MLCKNCGNPATTTMSMNDGELGIFGNSQAYLCNDCHEMVMKAVHKQKVKATVAVFAVLAIGGLIAGAFMLWG